MSENSVLAVAFERYQPLPIYPNTSRTILNSVFRHSENIVLRSTDEDLGRNWIPEIDKSRNKVPARAFFIRVINHINNDLYLRMLSENTVLAVTSRIYFCSSSQRSMSFLCHPTTLELSVTTGGIFPSLRQRHKVLTLTPISLANCSCLTNILLPLFLYYLVAS